MRMLASSRSAEPDAIKVLEPMRGGLWSRARSTGGVEAGASTAIASDSSSAGRQDCDRPSSPEQVAGGTAFPTPARFERIRNTAKILGVYDPV